MRRALLVVALLALGSPSAAQRAAGRADVDVILPVEPREHRRLQWFGRRQHHLVPGTVTINGSAYVCDVDGRTFRDEDDFVAHLRGEHRTAPERIPDLLVVRRGRVHFVGEGAAP
jgi:hypothetical protein